LAHQVCHLVTCVYWYRSCLCSLRNYTAFTANVWCNMLVFTIENAIGWIFTKFKMKCINFWTLVTPWRKVLKGKTMVALWSPKHEECENVCFVSILPRSSKMHAFVCLVFDEWFVKTFFSSFWFHPGYKNNMEEKNLPSTGFACLWRIWWCKFHLGEDWIRKLCCWFKLL